MKKPILWAFAVALLAAGCSENDPAPLPPPPAPVVVTQLVSPSADATLDLSALDAPVRFSWEEPAEAGAEAVTYTLLFDRAGGDFSEPLQRLAADDEGLSCTADLTPEQLDRIAATAEAAPGASVSLCWAVEAAAGGERTLSTMHRTITVTRLPEQVPFPVGEPLRMTGEGTEQGQLFKYLDNGDYEIYTRLEAGKPYAFHAADEEGGSAGWRFSLNEASTGLVELAATAEPAGRVAQTGVYRIRLHFGTLTASVERIEKVVVRHCNKFPAWDVEMAYDARGVWLARNYNVRLSKLNGNLEERYKFVFTVDGAEEHWGMSGSFGGRPAIGQEGYYDLRNVDAKQWAGAFKYPRELIDPDDLQRWYADIELRMTADGPYTHRFSNPIDGSTLPAAYTNPLFTRFALPDPDVIRADDGYFYLYTTEATDANTKNGPIMRSADLINWQRAGTMFTDATHPQITDNPTARLWAPSVNRIGDKYVIYYSQPGKNYKHAIGVATADSPTGPFTDHGKLIDSNEQGVDISIDAYLYQEDGRNYLFWGSFRKISVLELTADGLAIKDKATQVRTEVAGGQYEASVVLKRNGYYYLIVSTGDYAKGGTYRLVVGRAEHVLGPYLNKAGKDMMKVNHEPVLKGNAAFSSPGHCSRVITDDAGQDWILYHAYPADKDFRCLMLDRLEWVDGWPVVQGQEPSTRGLTAPVFNR